MIQLLDAHIFHQRVRPRSNRFGYRALYCLLPLEALSKPRAGLFAIDRPGLFSLRSADYGKSGITPAAHIHHVLQQWNLVEADGETELMTLPRVLGYGFNPVSFWLCRDKKGDLRAVMAEVNNTFGERHSYLCFHEDRRAIASGDILTARKAFHVSPFIDVQGDYTFRFRITRDRVAITIDLADGDGLLLRTAVGGRLQPLTSISLIRTLLENPLYPFKVIGLIHYQAVKLFLKGIRHFRKPAPPAIEISHG
jgi:DUF1365 family protein